MAKVPFSWPGGSPAIGDIDAELDLTFAQILRNAASYALSPSTQV